ncbi:MAG: HAD family hydrolase [Candidatus Marinimicrobia bacterium]|nr:HAD family hydrolase [Candidatus Neomarinimicrobiota bacterium]
MSISAIIWDWNGTLLDDVNYAIGCMNQLLAKRKMPILNRDRYREIFGFPVESYYRRLGFDFEAEAFIALSREFINCYYGKLAVPEPHIGARQLVEDLSGAGVSQAILSAMELGPLHEQLAANDFLDLFVLIHGLNHIHASSKIDEGRQLLNRLGQKGEAVLYIGDTTHDLEVAEALSVKSVILTHGHQSADQFQDAGSELLESFDELREYLRVQQGIRV